MEPNGGNAAATIQVPVLSGTNVISERLSFDVDDS